MLRTRRALPGRSAVLRLLVEVHGAVPAPVDEHPVSTPRMSALLLSIANGESHDSENVSDAGRLISLATPTANSSSAPTWAKIITRWMCADSSVPSTQIVVITG